MAAKKDKNWIKTATSKNKGAFARPAKRAGMSTQAYAKKVLKPGSRATATTKRRAGLARTLMGFSKK